MKNIQDEPGQLYDICHACEYSQYRNQSDRSETTTAISPHYWCSCYLTRRWYTIVREKGRIAYIPDCVIHEKHAR